MNVVTVEITTRPAVGQPGIPVHSVSPEPAGLIIVDDVESLTEGTTAACNDDNPYK
ncbi:hypothetical protein [Streptomyces mirabilis]|uniref:hypothetical protein n=1 Tax=Streptomyces mirabilis TaxID=68239 RepID=UPI00367388D0